MNHQLPQSPKNKPENKPDSTSEKSLGTDYRSLEEDYEERGWDTDANTDSRFGRKKTEVGYEGPDENPKLEKNIQPGESNANNRK
jgi:hypothetical protein